MPPLRTLVEKGSQTSIVALMGFFGAFFALISLVVFLPQRVTRATLDVPQVLSFQGKLSDGGRITVDDGSYNMKFAIYSAASGGTCLWSADDTDANTATIDCTGNTPDGAVSVAVSQGNFDVLLGDVAGGQNALPDALFDDNSVLYLGITIGADAEMSPRIRVASTAYSLQSGDSDLLDSFDSSQVGGTDKVVVTNVDGTIVLTLADDGKYLRFISTGDETALYSGSTAPTFSAEGGSLYLLDDNAGTGTPKIYFNTSTTDTGTDWTEVLLAGAISLDSAYDAGGSGVGKEITIDSGALTLTGSNAADYTLLATNSGNGGVFKISNTGTGSSFWVEDEASDTTPFVIDATGQVGIGKSTPSSLLTVGGSADIESNLVVGSSTSLTETLANAGFVLGGDDLFVAGMAGIEGSVYSDTSFIVGDATTLSSGSLTGSSALVIDASGTLSLNTTNNNAISTGTGAFAVNGRLNVSTHAANQGLRLPTSAGAPSSVTGTSEGDVVWDSTGDALYIYNGAAFTQIGGGGGSDLDSVYTADSDKILSVNTSTGLLFDLDSTGNFQIRNSSNVPIFSVSPTAADIEFGNTASNLSRNINIYNGNESTTQTNFTNAVTNAGVLIETNYTANAYTPGLFWSTSDNNATVPKAGIYAQVTGTGSYLYLGTSNSYVTGVNKNLSIDPNGSLTVPGRIIAGTHGANVGLKLPTYAGTPTATTGTVEGDIVWDSTGNALYVYNGSAFSSISGGGGGSSDLDTVYSADSDKILSVNTSTGLFVDLDSTGSFQVRNSTNSIIADFQTDSDIAFDGTTLFVDATNNRVGLGTITPNFVLDVYKATAPSFHVGTSIAEGAKIWYDNGVTNDVYIETMYPSSGYDMVFRTSSYSSAYEALRLTFAGDLTAGTSNALYVARSAGRVGIGNAAPSALFSVGSSSQLTVDSSGNLVTSGTANITGNVTVDTTTLFVDATNNRVGVGTITPNYDLDVYKASNPALHIGTSLAEGVKIWYDSATTKEVFIDSMYTSAGYDMVFRASGYTSAYEGMRLAYNGDVSIGPSQTLFFDYSANRIGIGGNTTPGQELEVDGDIRLDLNGTATTNGLCHSTAGTTNEDIVDCSGAPSDIAEWYETDGASPGEILVASGTTISFTSDKFDAETGTDTGLNVAHEVSILTQSTETYQQGVIGVVSTSPFQTFGEAIRDVATNPRAIALIGRVPVKVNDQGGAIQIGDAITTSGSSGVGMKASKPGAIIGYALSAWSGVGESTIEVFLSLGQGTGRSLVTTGYSVESQDDLTFASTNIATLVDPAYNSQLLSFRGSAWDVGLGEAANVGFSFENVVTDTDNYRLSIKTLTDTEVAYVTESGTFGVSGDLVVSGKIYPSDRGIVQTDKYIYYDGDTGPGGDFIRTNASGWATGSYDFAELFPSTEALQPGEVVVFASEAEHIQRSASSYSSKLAGIISTRPGFLAGENLPDHYPVALAGRVPTRVSAENGAIQVGDALTSSATYPGYAMKATKAGQIVGYALEPFSGPTTEKGSIIVFVRVSFADPALASVIPGTSSEASGSPVTKGQNLAALNMEGNIYVHGNEIIGIGRLSGLSDGWEMDADGRLTTHGSFDVLVESYQGEDVRTHTKLATEHLVSLSGSGVLSRGSAQVVFEDISPSFNDITSTTAPVRVLVTLRGPANGLFVGNADHNGFSVQETLGGVSDAEFDWYVEAYRKDYEPIEEVVNEPVVEEIPPVEADPVVDPAVEPIVDPIVEPVVDPVVDPTPVEVPVVDPVVAPEAPVVPEVVPEVVPDPLPEVPLEVPATP